MRESQTWRVTLATLVLPALSIVVGTLVLFLMGDRLPDPLATHWGIDGEPDGFTSRSSVPWIFAGYTSIVGGLLGVVAHAVPRSILDLRWLRGLPLALVWFGSGLIISTTAIQLDTDGSVPLPPWVIAVAVGLGAAGLVIGALVSGGEDPADSEAFATAPSTVIDHTPVAKPILVVASMVVVVGLTVGLLGSWWIALVFAPILVLLVVSSTFEIGVGDAGLEVRAVGLGWPRVRVPSERIASIAPGRVDAWSFGGWGLRVGAGGEAAVITRTGPALVVTRDDGSTLRVSCDRPEEVAAALESVLGAGH